jgi:hypothetical protein
MLYFWGCQWGPNSTRTSLLLEGFLDPFGISLRVFSYEKIAPNIVLQVHEIWKEHVFNVNHCEILRLGNVFDLVVFALGFFWGDLSS